MDRLDHAAEALFLTRSVTGIDVKLISQKDKRLLARWCSLIACLCDQTQRVKILNRRTHRAVRYGRPPSGTMIWLFRTVPPDWTIKVYAESRTLAQLDSLDTPHSYFLTFGINQLVVQVLIPAPGVGGFRAERTGTVGLFRQLWPAPLMPFFWPPPMALRFEDIPKLANAFQGPAE
jgi:hypothetical protein